MQIVDSSATYGLVDGWMPVSAAAHGRPASRRPGAASRTSSRVTFGAAINEANYSTFADVASQTNGLTGAGVTVGVLSDSFNNLGGYATDVSTGDLPANVNIIQEGTGGEDEGRAHGPEHLPHRPGRGSGVRHRIRHRPAVRPEHPRPGQAGANIIVDDVGTGSRSVLPARLHHARPSTR